MGSSWVSHVSRLSSLKRIKPTQMIEQQKPLILRQIKPALAPKSVSDELANHVHRPAQAPDLALNLFMQVWVIGRRLCLLWKK
jgi:hypothetical protein